MSPNFSQPEIQKMDNDVMTSFQDEFHAQGSTLKAMLSFYRSEGKALLERWNDILSDCKTINLFGMGTSEHVGYLVKHRFNEMGRRVTVEDASEFLHYSRVLSDKKTANIFISQSGESIETKKLFLSLDASGHKISICNNPKSTLAKDAEVFLPMLAGAESSISNKTYLNTLAILLMMAGETVERLEPYPDIVDRSLKIESIENIAEIISAFESLDIIARGPAFTSARQLALTLREGTRLKTAAWNAGAFRHGPLESAGKGHCALLLAPQGKTCELMISLGKQLVELGSTVIVVGDNECLRDISPNTVIVEHPGGETFFPLAIAGIHCRLIDLVAGRRGLIAGDFKVISKVTDTELNSERIPRGLPRG